MNRETSLLFALGLLSAIAPPIFAQDLQGRPDPVPPTTIVGPQLIAWSELQRPQPIPERVPEPGRNAQQANQKPVPSSSVPQKETEQESRTGIQGQKKK